MLEPEDAMPAYVIVEIEVLNPEPYEEYKKMSPISIGRFGGRFIARGGKAELLEGENPPKRVVILEFPSYDRAKEWWASDEYAPAKALRQANSRGRMVLVEGV